ncbi:MAG: phenylalanine--tRNA ligase subunit alpha [Candidatus Micrarchaeia archaeon]
MSDVNLKNIAEMLSKDERLLLVELAKFKNANFKSLEESLNWEYARVSRNSLWLENKAIAKINKKKEEKYVLTKLGEEALVNKLPERKLFDYLLNHNNASIKDVESIIKGNELNIAIGSLKKLSLLNTEKQNLLYLSLLSKDDKKIRNIEEIIEKIKRGQHVNEEEVIPLLGRLVEKITEEEYELAITDLGVKIFEIIKNENLKDTIELLSSDIIRDQSWKNKKFKRYDITSPVPPFIIGRKHPLIYVMNMVMDAFIAMGFKETEGPWIETSFWNMDSMFIPQDHPARDIQDTFYLNKKGKLPEKSVVEKVRAAQENGGDTGSIGYQYLWNPEIAKEILMRTQTTSTTFRNLYRGVANPSKLFYIGRVFRNENIDKTHLPEFHQIEGVVVGDGLNLRNLMGYLKEFYELLGIKNLKFKPTYNPYTEPSMEIFYYHQHFKKWFEIGNSGIFRPEALKPYNIDKPVLGWGLALERLAMILYNVNDIREILGNECKLEFIQSYQYREL